MRCGRCQAEWTLGALHCQQCGADASGASAEVVAGMRLFKSHRYRDALEAFVRALELEPGDPDLLRIIGHAYFHLRQPSEAEAYYRQLGEWPGSEAAFNLGQIALASSRFGLARRTFARLLERPIRIVPGEFYFGIFFSSDTQLHAECHFYSALAAWNAHEPGAAEHYFQRALALVPDHLRALRYLGNLRFQQRRFEQAEADLRRYIELYGDTEMPDKTTLEVMHQLGLTCEALGRNDDAIELFKTILNFRPGHPGAVFNLNRLYEEKGIYNDGAQPLRPEISADEEGASTIFGLSSSEKDERDEQVGSLKIGELTIIGKSKEMVRVLRVARLASASDATVLLTGENGTGKEMIARAIMLHSARRDRPFVAVNCAALPQTLIESELFGYVKGAFTGAADRKHGYFEAADGGTLLLDEIGELDLNMQVKLLRVLQEREFIPVGGERSVNVDVRIIAATNKKLSEMVEAGLFREDLYYRLNVLPIHVPPLRDRPEDIQLLAGYFIRKYSKGAVRPESLLNEEDLKRLSEYRWPGNVRELENIIERGIVLGRRYHMLLEEQMLLHQHSEQPRSAPVAEIEPDRPATRAELGNATMTEPEEELWVPLTLQELERRHIQSTLRHTEGNRSKAARLLGINPTTLWRKIKTYEIESQDSN